MFFTHLATAIKVGNCDSVWPLPPRRRSPVSDLVFSIASVRLGEMAVRKSWARNGAVGMKSGSLQYLWKEVVICFKPPVTLIVLYMSLSSIIPPWALEYLYFRHCEYIHQNAKIARIYLGRHLGLDDYETAVIMTEQAPAAQ